jgi:hypothetical protein
MTQQDHATQDQIRPETSTGHYLLEVLGILCFVLLLLFIGLDAYQGMIDFRDLWLAPILAYLAADFLCGFVHFLADTFGSYDTLIIGPFFIEPFRGHHIDPKGIVGNDFVDANNSLASLHARCVGYRAFGDYLLWVSLRDVLSLLVPRRLPYQPVPQVGAHGYPAGLCRLAPGVECDPLQGAPRHRSREPPTTPTTASPRGSGILYWIAPASSSGWSV